MDDFTAVAPINGYGSYLPDEIIARTDLSAEAKILCHELDKYRNGDPRSERYLQCNPGHFTLQQKCGFRSKRQVEQIVRDRPLCYCSSLLFRPVQALELALPPLVEEARRAHILPFAPAALRSNLYPRAPERSARPGASTESHTFAAR